MRGTKSSGRGPSPQSWRGVAAGLEARFNVGLRDRGQTVFMHGDVRIEDRSPTAVLAQVDGEPGFRTSIERKMVGRGVRYDLTCTCPTGRREIPCEHVWALALALDQDAERAEEAAVGGGAADDRLRRLVSAGPAPSRAALTASEVGYVIEIDSDGPTPCAVVEVRVTEGGGSRRRQRVPLVNEGPVGDDEDRNIQALLRGALPPSDSGPERTASFPLTEELGALLLPRIVATGRCRWRKATPEDAPLSVDEGGPWKLELTYHRVSGGGATVDGHLARRGEHRPLASLHAALPGGLWLDAERLGWLEPEAAWAWAAELASGGTIEVPAKAAGDWIAALAAVSPETVEGAVERRTVEPTPVLRVDAAGRDGSAVRQLACSILFRYGERAVDLFDAAAVVADKGGAWIAPRVADAERRAVQTFVEYGGQAPDPATGSGSVEVGELPLLARELLGAGWQVEAEGRRWRLHTGTQMRVRTGVDWFDLEGAVEFGGGAASLPTLLRALEQQKPTVTLDDGSIGLLPEEWLAGQGLLHLASETEDGNLRFGHGQGALLDALLEGKGDVEVDRGFLDLRDRLRAAEEPRAVEEPKGFEGELRPYQREGLGWLDFLAELGLGGCLADEMGLGKTVQVLAFLEERRARRAAERKPRVPSLVVAPSSLLFNWLDEAERFAPNLATLAYAGPDRAGLVERFDEVDLVVTSYALLRRDAPILAEFQFDVAILDEAQAIKNAASQVAKASRLLRARSRFALSGTPIENHLGELWSLFEFLNPGLLGRSTAFRRLVRQPLGKATDADGDAPSAAASPSAADDARAAIAADAALDEAELAGSPSIEPVEEEPSDVELLARAVRPFVLRRTKRQVLEDLPEKTEQTVLVELDAEERRAYDELRAHYRSALLPKVKADGTVGKHSIQVLEALLRLRQAACHRALIDSELSDQPSAKLDRLVAMVEELVESGSKALIFSQFTSFLALVRKALDDRGLAYEYLDGSTRDRKTPVERFQSDDGSPLFLVSLKAGGTGLNLTAADYVFLLDPWWNPAAEAQAIDRAHRIGRTERVVAYRLIAHGTVEERVLELQEEKRALVGAVLDAAGGSVSDLSRDDLERLLG